MNVGDVVYVKTDSRPMTVKQVDGDTAVCYTKDPNGNLVEREFPVATLTVTRPAVS